MKLSSLLPWPALLLAAGCVSNPPAPPAVAPAPLPPLAYVIGADLSFLKQAEGVAFDVIGQS